MAQLPLPDQRTQGLGQATTLPSWFVTSQIPHVAKSTIELDVTGGLPAFTYTGLTGFTFQVGDTVTSNTHSGVVSAIVGPYVILASSSGTFSGAVNGTYALINYGSETSKFYVGDTVTGGTSGSTATVVSDNGTGNLIVSSPTAAFDVAETVAGTEGLITYTGASGPFTVGETVTGGTSSATGVVVSGVTGGNLIVNTISGTFVAAETITGGTSANTATVATYTAPASVVVTVYSHPASATIASYTNSYGTDQVFTLLPGTEWALFDVVITNASESLTTVDGLQIWSGPNRTGNLLVTVTSNLLANLTSASQWVGRANAVLGTNLTFSHNLVEGNQLFLSYTTPQGSAATADFYLYAYPINQNA